MVFTKVYMFETTEKLQEIDISDEVRAAVAESGINDGMVLVFTGHTTAGVYLGNTDRHLPRDIESFMEELVPNKPTYLHNIYGGRNASAHLKYLLMGASVVLPVVGGKPYLGRWQAVFLSELDGPRKRELIIKVVGE